MSQEKKVFDKIIAKAAYEAAKKNVNSICYYWFYQPEVPNAVKKLKDHKC